MIETTDDFVVTSVGPYCNALSHGRPDRIGMTRKERVQAEAILDVVLA